MRGIHIIGDVCKMRYDTLARHLRHDRDTHVLLRYHLRLQRIVGISASSCVFNRVIAELDSSQQKLKTLQHIP